MLLAVAMSDDTDRQIRVLVVDDDPAIRLLVATAMERHGFDVESAKDGIEALEKLEEDNFDLLVLDLMMPHLDGLGVVERLYASGQTQLPKIMIMTAASPNVLRQVPRERVGKIITKPFDLTTLIDSANDLAGTPK